MSRVEGNSSGVRTKFVLVNVAISLSLIHFPVKHKPGRLGRQEAEIGTAY